MACVDKRVMKCGEVRYRVRVRRLGVPAFSLTFETEEEARHWIKTHELAYMDCPDAYVEWSRVNRTRMRRIREIR